MVLEELAGASPSFHRLLALAYPHILEIALEEVVQGGADDRNCGHPPDVVPFRGDRGLEYVGGKLEGRPRHQPTRIAQPDVPLLMTGGRGQHCSDTAEK